MSCPCRGKSPRACARKHKVIAPSGTRFSLSGNGNTSFSFPRRRHISTNGWIYSIRSVFEMMCAADSLRALSENGGFNLRLLDRPINIIHSERLSRVRRLKRSRLVPESAMFSSVLIGSRFSSVPFALVLWFNTAFLVELWRHALSRTDIILFFFFLGKTR